jgi:hypothetical protein
MSLVLILKIESFPEKVNFYIVNNVSHFKSQTESIRCNSVIFAGYLIGNLNKDQQNLLSKEHISNGN